MTPMKWMKVAMLCCLVSVALGILQWINVRKLRAELADARKVCTMVKARATSTVYVLRSPGTVPEYELVDRATAIADLVVACSGDATFEYARVAGCRGVPVGYLPCVADVLERAAEGIP